MSIYRQCRSGWFRMIGKHDYWNGDVDRFQHLTPVGFKIINLMYEVIYYPSCGEAFVRPAKWRRDFNLRHGFRLPSPREQKDGFKTYPWARFIRNWKYLDYPRIKEMK